MATESVLVSEKKEIVTLPTKVPLPFLDDEHKPHAIALPFKDQLLYSLHVPASSGILCRYYTTAMKCIGKNDKKTLLQFNHAFYHWIIVNVVPHLQEINLWYPGFGCAMQIIETMHKNGLSPPHPMPVRPPTKRPYVEGGSDVVTSKSEAPQKEKGKGKSGGNGFFSKIIQTIKNFFSTKYRFIKDHPWLLALILLLLLLCCCCSGICDPVTDGRCKSCSAEGKFTPLFSIYYKVLGDKAEKCGCKKSDKMEATYQEPRAKSTKTSQTKGLSSEGSTSDTDYSPRKNPKN